MRYRALSDIGDYTFGQGSANFLINVPEGVAQLVLTRLRLLQGEWFLDTQDGTPYMQKILGKTTKQGRDLAVRSRIRGTQGVRSILQFNSVVESPRKYVVTATIDTIYGTTLITSSLTTPFFGPHP